MTTKHLSKILLSALAITSLIGVESMAEAGRAGGRQARTRTTQSRSQARTRRTRTTQPRNRVNQRSNGLKDANHLAKVKSEVQRLKKIVMNGEPDGSGSVNFYAAQATLISAGGIKANEVKSLSYGEGKDQSQRITVSGVTDGKWHGHLLGTVSTHDLANLSWSAYESAVNKRIAADRIQVSYDHGPGTARTVVASGIKSKAATEVALSIPLNKGGITRVIYDRTNASGQVVGSSNAYVGRIVEIQWNGN